jgi:hypothetical protein
MTYRRLLLIGVPVLGSLILGLGYAWHQYGLRERQHQTEIDTAARLRQVFATDQGLTESLMGPLGDVTYNEFLRTCDNAIDKRNELIATVRSLPPNIFAPLREQTISYMKDMNELVRAKAHLTRLTMQWHAKTRNQSADFARFQAGYSGLGGPRTAIEYAYRRTIAEVNALSREMKESSDEFDAVYGKLRAEEEAVVGESRRAGVTFEPGLRKFAEANRAWSASARNASK